jgi:hypothetical protein
VSDTGWKYPASAEGDRGAQSITWSSADNIGGDEGQYATADFTFLGELSKGLGGASFGLGVPAGATIDGIEVRVGDYSRVGSAGPAWLSVNLTLANKLDGVENKISDIGAGAMSTILSTAEAGGVAELWSETIDDTDVNNVNWGFNLHAEMLFTNTTSVRVDFYQMVVYYTSEEVAASGTITSATESDVAAGGETIVLDLTGVSWQIGGAFDAQRQNIIDGISSSQTETLGWNNEVRDTMGVDQVVRSGSSKVTITLLAAEVGDYKITANEVLTATIPASAHSGGDILTHEDFATITAECDQTLPPITIATQTNLSGAVTDIDEPVDSPDANWLLLA